MAESAGANLIGAGAIGAAIAFETNKSDYRANSVDKYTATGYGPVSGFRAIVRKPVATLETNVT